MIQSTQIGTLAAALAKAQGEFRAAIKDQVNPFFKSNYADLASVYEASREALTKHGLSVVQGAQSTETGWILISCLMHSSGEFIRFEYPIIAAKQDAQGFGAAVTYARRYALQALLGIASMDDDGETASGRGCDPSHQPPVPTQAIKNPAKQVTEAQLKRLFAISRQAQWSDTQVKEYISRTFKKESTRSLTMGEYDQLCDAIQAGPHQTTPTNEDPPSWVREDETL